MRYILIDPYAKSVTAEVDPNIEVPAQGVRHQTIFRILDCQGYETQLLGTRPSHAILADEEGMHKTPQPPSFKFGEMHLVGKAMILGCRASRLIECSLSVERVEKPIRFDAGEKTF